MSIETGEDVKEEAGIAEKVKESGSQEQDDSDVPCEEIVVDEESNLDFNDDSWDSESEDEGEDEEVWCPLPTFAFNHGMILKKYWKDYLIEDSEIMFHNYIAELKIIFIFYLQYLKLL